MDYTTTTQSVSQREARDNIKSLQGPALNAVLDHIATLHNESLTTCALANDDVLMRRAQGEVKAFKAVMELFEYVPVKQRRAVSRHLV